MRKIYLTLILVSLVLFVSAQDQYLRRDIKPNMSLKKTQTYTLDIFNGLSFPQGSLNNFLKDGFNSGVLIHKRFTRKLSIGLSANHSRFNHKQGFGVLQSSKRHELSTTSFDIGPQYNLTLGRFALEFYGRSGLSIVNSPQSIMLYPETDIAITSLEAYKSTALTTRLGANMTANIADGLNLYLSSEYITSLNSDLNYQTRDLSSAFRDDGSLNSDMANELPYQNKSLSLSMLNVNVGVRISFGGNGQKRNSNFLYRNRKKSETNPFYEGKSSQIDLNSKTQNANLSRKEKPSSDESSDNKEEKVSLINLILSRSKNTSVIAPSPYEDETVIESKNTVIDEATLADIPLEKLRLKSKAQLAKERRQKKRAERRAKRKLERILKQFNP